MDTRNHEALDGLYEYFTDVQAFIFSAITAVFSIGEFIISGLISNGAIATLVGDWSFGFFQIDTGKLWNLVFWRQFSVQYRWYKLVGILPPISLHFC